MSRSTLRARRRRAHSPAGRTGSWLALPRVARWRMSRRGVWGTLALLALLCLSAWMGSGLPQARGAAASQAPRVATLRARAPTTIPAVLHWVDTVNQTAYTVRVTAAGSHATGELTFSLPTGDQIRGSVPLQAQADGTSTQQTSGPSGACASGILATAKLEASASGTPTTTSHVGAGKPATTPVLFALTTRIGPQGLVAYAGLGYASADDAAGVERVCGSGAIVFQVLAGCTAQACTDPLATASPNVGKHNSALTRASAANTRESWSAVYAISSQSVKAQYTAADFANALSAQQKARGKITRISPITTPPVVQYDAAGQAYFAVTQTVTLDRNGATSARQVTSYYVLEDGEWHFWFSA
jgi:hypothetical protein